MSTCAASGKHVRAMDIPLTQTFMYCSKTEVYMDVPFSLILVQNIDCAY